MRRRKGRWGDSAVNLVEDGQTYVCRANSAEGEDVKLVRIGSYLSRDNDPWQKSGQVTSIT
jgi:hypothetical protein